VFELQGTCAAGRCFHVLQQRGNRQPLFGELVDYIRYLDYLQDALLRYGVFCHAYVLLSDQVQLLLSGDCREGVMRVMTAVGDRHCWSNESSGTPSRVAQDPGLRHFAHRIRNDRHLHAARHYIECKPVRSGLVSHPEGYYWSSYACGAGEHK
jgi:putative transposase